MMITAWVLLTGSGPSSEFSALQVPRESDLGPLDRAIALNHATKTTHYAMTNQSKLHPGEFSRDIANVSGLSAFPRCRFPRLPWPVRSTCSFSCREDGSIFCLGSPRRPTSTSLARFPRRPEHGTARARLLARAPSSKSRRAFVGKTSDATLLSSRGG